MSDRDIPLGDDGQLRGELAIFLPPDWPLTPEALQGKNHEFIYATISEGRHGTPMPPWRMLLTEQDINWIVDYLKGPEETQ